MRRSVTFCVLVCAWALAGPAALSAQASDLAPPAIQGEEELTQGVRSGRLGRDELVRLGRQLSYFQKLKLYYYAQELGPYFEGVEEAIRDLARTPACDRAAIQAKAQALYQAMAVAWGRLAKAQRSQLEVDWRRGLTGLIFLDFDWRDRIAEQGKDEIKNPYDLAALMDCLDARLRGLTSTDIDECPAAALSETGNKSNGQTGSRARNTEAGTRNQ